MRPTQARRKYDVPYPNLYAVPGVDLHFTPPTEDAKLLSNGDSEKAAAAANGSGGAGAISAQAAFEFNCIQRGHQNTLEKLPLVLAMTVLSVFSYPIVGGVGAIVFVIGRCLYAWGYARAPAKRQYGSITYAGMFLLVGVNMAFAVQLFRGVGPY